MSEPTEADVRAEVSAWLKANWNPEYGLVEWRLKLIESGWGARVFHSPDALLQEAHADAMWVCVPPELQGDVLRRAGQHLVEALVLQRRDPSGLQALVELVRPDRDEDRRPERHRERRADVADDVDDPGRLPRVLVPEMNLGQLSRLLRAEYLVDAQSVTKVKGVPFTAGTPISAT